ncbi:MULTISPECIES: hypothetical protein [unclassified Wolbachia]|uniref:hypothetical protein n=1 Tax=unclassified Wolbachia TaxID=2640676 RepID=UPI00222F0536|nr:hypothetical protein [Wolbachia endosymbiont (group A) of Apoderus coryli]
MNKHLRVTSASRVSSQCVTLGSRKKEAGSQCLGTGMTRKEHWDDKKGATRMTPS